jgi:histidine triad (HIT) family protein
MDGCIFCKIVKGELPSKKVYESGDILAFDDINPAAPIHVLIVPKKHLRNLAEASLGDIELLGKLNLAAVEIARKLGIGEEFKLTTNTGILAGQIVMHLHYHLLGGWLKKTDVISEIHK